jgi:hypothetical protein
MQRSRHLDGAGGDLVSAARQSDYQMLEYACHEGNYSMRNTLSGSRAEERGN